MTGLKEITTILLKETKLYEECGLIFKYLGEVRINFSSLSHHNIPWQMSQILEIVYSNKLDGYDLNIFDVIIAYSTNYLDDTLAKKAAWMNFDATYYISKLRKNDDGIQLSSFEKIIDIVQKHCDDIKDDYDSKNFLKHFSEESLSILEKLLNGTYSNNPLYFFPLYLLIIEDALKNIRLKNIIRSILINLYLMKNKLLFAPTLCFSYPLLYSYKEYENLIEEVKKDSKKIVKFSKFIYDILKQSAVVSRAFISDFSKLSTNLQIMCKKEKTKIFENLKINNFLKLISFNEEILSQIFKQKNNRKSKEIINFFNLNNAIVEIKQTKKLKVYIFKEFYNTIKKLNKNKSEKTTKIFILKENLN